MNVAILTAFHGRPDISEIYVRYLRAVRPSGIRLFSFSGITTGEYQPFIPDVICRNLPVSEKHNRIGEFICDYADGTGVKFDYVMQLGSDDVISPEIFDLYRPAFGDLVIGLKDMVFHSVQDGRTKIIHKTQFGNAFGAGRMIRFDLFRKHRGRIWPADKNSGLDWYSFEKLNQRETLFSQRNNPVCVDLKTSENIWKFDSLKGTEIPTPKWLTI